MDFTQSLTRQEAMETRMGVALQALYLNLDAPQHGEEEWRIQASGEIHAGSTAGIEEDLDIVAVAYDDANRVVATCEAYVDSDSFAGFDVFSMSMFSPLKPARVLIYPKPT